MWYAFCTARSKKNDNQINTGREHIMIVGKMVKYVFHDDSARIFSISF